MPRRKKEQRRERGEGGLYCRKDGRWCAVLDLPREFPGGPRRRKIFYGATKEEARDRKMAWAVGTKEAPTTSAKGTLGELLDFWIANVQALKISENSLSTYRVSFKHLKSITGYQLNKLTNTQIQTCIATIARKVTPQVAARALMRLRQALKFAVKTGRLKSSPADAVESPRYSRRLPNPLTAEQVYAFIDAVAGDLFEAGFWLSLCGLRSGEVRGACWGDIDWAAGTIRVERQAKPKPGGFKLGDTKTKSSVRTVYLPPQALEALERARAAWRLVAMTRKPELRDLIVLGRRGGILPSSSYARAYTKVLKTAGIPHRALHNLRHTFATLATNAGAAPPAVQAQLGHKNPDMTFAYTHPTPEGQSRAAATYGEAIKKKRVE